MKVFQIQIFTQKVWNVTINKKLAREFQKFYRYSNNKNEYFKVMGAIYAVKKFNKIIYKN